MLIAAVKAGVWAYRHQNECWTWFLSIDGEEGLDGAERFRSNKALVGFVRMEPPLPVGLASDWVKRLNRKHTQEWNWDKVRGELIHSARGLGGTYEQWVSRINPVQIQLQPNRTQASTSSRAPLDIRVLDQLIHILAGRSLLPEELEALLEDTGLEQFKHQWRRYVQAGLLNGRLELVSGLELISPAGAEGGSSKRITDVGVMRCNRCGGTGPDLHEASCPDCGGSCKYCTACIMMGRVKSCTILIRGGSRSKRSKQGKPPCKDTILQHWGLSPAQYAASSEGLRFLEKTCSGGGLQLQEQKLKLKQKPHRFLIWAVTGAGKTEMIFPLVEYELVRGGRVLITTPRRDVVIELKPRIERAFQGYRTVTLYGGSEDRWEVGDITLATTHQLMRFHQAFDLVIIDELDAFPYHNNPQLEFAANQVCSKQGRYVLLSATPPKKLQQEASEGRLEYVRVPVRYHRHPLPVPKWVRIPPLERVLRASRLPGNLLRHLQDSLERGAQVFVFVPKIVWVEPLVKLLRRAYPQHTVFGTSSKDEKRSEKVVEFRQNTTDILVTTTILERGVTVPKTDVVILGANSALFDEASLVQMAGRAGRSKDDPAGRVFLMSAEWTRSQAGAVKQIKTMNGIAAKKGFLLSGTAKGSNHNRFVLWRSLNCLLRAAATFWRGKKGGENH